MTDEKDLDYKALYQEAYSSWLTTLSVLVLKSGGEVTITSEECKKILEMGIRKEDIRDVNGKLTGDIKFIGVFDQPNEQEPPS